MNFAEEMKKFEQAVERGLPCYCDKCREQEINLYETVLSWDECEELNIDYYDAHTNACKIANCNHQFWYSPDDPKLNDPYQFLKLVGIDLDKTDTKVNKQE